MKVKKYLMKILVWSFILSSSKAENDISITGTTHQVNNINKGSDKQNKSLDEKKEIFPNLHFHGTVSNANIIFSGSNFTLNNFNDDKLKTENRNDDRNAEKNEKGENHSSQENKINSNQTEDEKPTNFFGK